MKFGKVLKVSSENMPSEMHDLFLRYKELKKQIKLIPVSKDPAPGEKQASVPPDGSGTGSGGSTGATTTATALSSEEQAFITTLNEDLARFNRYFIEKEEEAVIRIQALCDELAAVTAAAGLSLPAALTNAATSLTDLEEGHTHPALPAAPGPAAPAAAATVAFQTETTQQQQRQLQPAPGAGASAGPNACEESEPVQTAEGASPSGNSPQQQQQQEQQQQQPGHHHHQHTHQHSHSHHHAALQGVKSRLVQFHGEMVLLLHWSLLNYAAVVKILKKHDKRTGVLLRAPYLANVLQQPFSSTTIMSRLAKRAEELVVATTQLAPTAAGGARPEAGAAGSGSRAALAAEAAAVPSAKKSSLPGDATSAQGPSDATASGGAGAATAPCAAAAPPSGRGAPSASDASTLTRTAEREGGFGDVSAHSEPLVGSTMHALETWANLRKNAITPSTVLATEVEQPPPQPPQPQQQQQPPVPSKRKAEDAAQDAGVAGGPPQQTKAAKLHERDGERTRS